MEKYFLDTDQKINKKNDEMLGMYQSSEDLLL